MNEDEKYSAIAEKLCQSVELGDLNFVKKILNEHPNLVTAPRFGLIEKSEILHVAANVGNTEICKLLVSLGADVNATNAHLDYITPLHNAAGHGHTTTVQFLLEQGAEVDGHPLSVTTPLIRSVISGHADVVQELLRKRADVHRLHYRLNTSPIDLAKSWGQKNIEEILKSYGATGITEITPDAEKQLGGPIINFIHNTAGWVLPSIFSPPSGLGNIELRISCIDGKNKHKLLFTVGLFTHRPRTELLLCLPGDWPLPRHKMASDDPWAFPVHLLSRLAQQCAAENLPLTEGDIIRRTDSRYADLAWPTGVDALLTVNKRWTKESDIEHIDEDDNVSLYLLVPIKFSKQGEPRGEKLTTLLQRKVTGSWSSVCVSPPGEPN